MVFSFRPDQAEVIKYGLRSHTSVRRNEWLLWPAYAYRVVAPPVRDRKINILQKVVLGICNTGETEPLKIASWLNLEQELIGLIIDELEAQEWLDRNHHVTEDGMRLLAEERNEMNSSKPDDIPVAVGYVFQDPFQGTLWPRFVEILSYQEIEIKNQWPVLILGSKGKPKTVHPFVKQFTAMASPEPPAPRDILRAVHRHQKAVRASGRFYQNSHDGFDLDEENDWGSGIAGNVLIDRVSIISDAPEACLLTSFIYLPKDQIDESDWFVCDPFGLYASAEFHDLIEQQFSSDRNLKEWIEQFLGKANLSLSRLDENRRIVQDLASEEIGRRLNVQIKDSPLYERLVAVERVYQAINSSHDDTSDQLEDLAVKLGKLLEQSFLDLQQIYPAKDAHSIFMSSDSRYREQLLIGIAQQLGFHVPLPRSFLYVKPGAVHHAAVRNEGAVAPKAVVALLTAHQNQEHPLHRAAELDSRLFEKIAEVVELRNRGAHANSDRLNKTQIRQGVENCYSIIQTIFPQYRFAER